MKNINPPENHVPQYPFRTIKNKYGFNPNRYYERCLECGFKSSWNETGIRHYPVCIHYNKGD